MNRNLDPNAILKHLNGRNGLIAFVVYLSFYVVYSYAAPRVHGTFEAAGQYGDMFGSVNAFASGLAMFGVMLAVLLQRQQNDTQAKELDDQKKAAEQQIAHAATQAQVAMDQLRHARAEHLQRNKPIVFIDRWEHAEKSDNYHYLMRNVGGGFAVNVYLIDRDETPTMVYPLGSLAADAERRLPERIQEEIARQWLGSGFILVAEGPFSRTTQWTSTLNFVTTKVDVRVGQVLHRLGEVPVGPLRGRYQSLEVYLANNLASLQEQIDQFWKAESERGRSTSPRRGDEPPHLRKICECPRRSWAKCPHSWHFSFKPKGGQRFRFSVDTEVGKHIEAKAEALADGWRTQIRDGTFRRKADASTQTEPVPSALTFNDFIEKYLERCEPPVSTNDRGCLRKFSAFVADAQPIGAVAIDRITEDAVELFFASLRKAAAAVSTRNKYIQAIKAAFRCATKKGYLARNPIADADGLTREKHAQRDRRLAPDVLTRAGKVAQEGEERRLLAVASPYLQRVIVAALETCCRRGELLALQWRDVDLQKRELLVRAVEEGAKKTGVGRRLPISTRLAAVLEMTKTAMETTLKSALPKGASDADLKAALELSYVFGDEAGLKVGDFKRAWETAVLKAYGHVPQWTKTNKALTAESRAALEAIDLHFHDLRHEGGSRLLEAGWPLHHVQHMLGHANLSQTSTYLNATKLGMQESMRRFPTSVAPGCNSVVNQAQTDLPPVYNDAPASDPEVVVN